MKVKRFLFRNCVAKVEEDRLTMRVEAGRNRVARDIKMAPAVFTKIIPVSGLSIPEKENPYPGIFSFLVISDNMR